jgi:hypothetical protein
MKKTVCALAAAICVLSVPAWGEPLNQHQMRQLFPGSYLVKVMGMIDLKVSMQSNGTITGLSKGQQDRGRWSVEGGKLCITWNTWNSGKKDCSPLTREGDLVKGRGFWFRAA